MNKPLRIVFTVLKVIAVAALVVFTVYFLWRVKVITLPKFLYPIFGVSETDTVIPGDGGEIFAAVKNGENTGEYTISPDVTPENVRQLLSSVRGRDNYVWETKSTVYSSKGSKTTLCTLRYYLGKYKIDLFDEKGKTKKTVYDDLSETVVTSYENSRSGTRATYASGSLDMFSQCGLASVSQFTSLPDDADCSLALISGSDGSVLYIEFDGTLDGYSQKEAYYISLDYGLVLRAESYADGKLTYLCETTALSEDAPVFDIFD